MSALRSGFGCLSSLVTPSTVGHARGMAQLAMRNTGLRAGSDGRQSVSGVMATVFGANGFLGRYVVSSIGECGGRVVCPHRCDDLDMQHLRPMGDLGNIVTLEGFSIRDDDMVKYTIGKSNVVINLIGQNTETWNYKYEEVHVDWPKRLAQFCAETPSVERLIHVSHLGAVPGSPSPRLDSVARGEAALLKAFPDATVMRLGNVVGMEDRFFNDLVLWRYSGYGVPVVDGGVNSVQPVFVVDVAQAIYKSLQFEDAKGSTYDLGGPEAMQMRQLAYVLCDELREDRVLSQVPTFLASPLAQLREQAAMMLPMHMMTRDLVFTTSAVAEGAIDKVVAEGAKSFADLEMAPRKVTEGVAIDHVRHWRKGGYDVGTNQPVDV